MYVSNEKRTPVSAYRLFASPSNKQIVFASFYETPCRCNLKWMHFIGLKGVDTEYKNLEAQQRNSIEKYTAHIEKV